MASPNTQRNRMLQYRNRKHVLKSVPHLKASTPSGSASNSINRALEAVSKAQATPKYKPLQPFRFFDLPGEIRNRVYDLVVPEARVSISGSHPQKELQEMKQESPLKKHKLPRYRFTSKFSTNPTEYSVLIACRQMNQEVIRYVYGRTTFCFDKFVVLRKFLNRCPHAARTSVVNLEITHVGYGEPVKLRDREWKLRYDAKWEAILKQVKKQTALRTLVLDITNFDWPIRLELTESWARPLLDLAGDGLDRVDVVLEQDRFAAVKCEVVGKELGKRMMTAEGRRKKRQEERLKAEVEKRRKEESRRKATKVLNVSLPNGAPKAKGPVKKVVKSTGLGQYTVAQPHVAFC